MEPPPQALVVRSPQASRLRSPLSISTNSPSVVISPTSSSAEQSALPRQRIRHKGSLACNKKDSSEETPGSNGSIYNAHSYSNSNSADSGSRAENASKVVVVSRSQENADDEPNWESWEPHMLSVDDVIGATPIIYGQGTRLDTIIEKNSNSTMHSLSHSKSTGALSIAPSSTLSILGHRDTFEVSRISRQRSLSLDDLNIVQRSYHEACAFVVGVKPKPPQLHIDDIYAQPKMPLLAPPERTPTPPGIPSWTALQQRPIPARRSSDTRSRILSWWNGQPSIPSRIPIPIGDGGRTSGPRRVISLPRYRPPRSAYPSLDNHPFHRLPITRPVDSQTPRLGGITVTKTWSVEYSDALQVPEQSSRPTTSDRLRTVHFSPSVVGGSEATATTLSNIHNLNRMGASSSSSSNPPTESLRKRLSLHRRSQTPLPSIRQNNNNENSSFGTTITTITAGSQGEGARPSAAASLKKRLSLCHSRALKQNNSNENVATASTITGVVTPWQENDRENFSPPGPTSPYGYTVAISVSPAASQNYLVPVTNLEPEKRRHEDVCLRWNIGGRLTKIGNWIDKTGERMEDLADRAGKKICLICCGWAEGEDEDESTVRVSTEGGGSDRELLRPRRVTLPLRVMVAPWVV